MSAFTNTLRAAVAALMLSVIPADAKADISYEEHESAQDHVELLDTLVDMGINVQINNPSICSREEGVAGYWIGADRLFVLCQQEIRTSSIPLWTGDIVKATDDDLDTIRHEAHHVIQDCMDGEIDGSLVTYLDEENSRDFLAYYDDWKEEYIAEQYRSEGASDHVVELEIEAWAVADLVNAPMINDVLKRECAGQ